MSRDHAEDPTARRTSPNERLGRIGTSVSLAVLIAAAVVAAQVGSASNEFLDLGVYRDAVDDWWSGSSPYTSTYVGGLRFNYPPSSLVLLAPLAILPQGLTGMLLVAIGAVLTVLVTRAVLPVQARPAGLALAALLALSEPFQTTWAYGQVNILVLGAVVVGLVTRDRSTRQTTARGGSIGAAAAMKLSPATFLVVDIARRRWAVVAGAASTITLLTLAATARVPSLLSDWIGRAVDGVVVVREVDSGRIESWLGLLRAMGGDTPATTVIWLVLSVLLMGTGVTVAVVAARRDDDAITAGAALAVAVLLVSPVTWTHHWVWTPMFIATAAGLLRSRRGADRFHIVVTGLLTSATVFWLPAWFARANHDLDVEGWHWIPSYSYVLLGTMFLMTLAGVVLTRPVTADDVPSAAHP